MKEDNEEDNEHDDNDGASANDDDVDGDNEDNADDAVVIVGGCDSGDDYGDADCHIMKFPINLL